VTRREREKLLSVLKGTIKELKNRRLTHLEICNELDKENVPLPGHVAWRTAGSWTQAYNSDCRALVCAAMDRWAKSIPGDSRPADSP
jgi:hypothetical protein